jgi:thiol-disulfide isomerase/thioredoxin
MAVVTASDSDFDTQLAQNPRVVVKYYADWCGNCRLFSPKFRRLSDAPENEGILFLDVNAEENPAARKLAGVTNLPFFATFRNGALVAGQATSKEENLNQMLEELRA